MKIVTCLIAAATLTVLAQTTVAKKQTEATTQATCILTCSNSDFVQPGNKQSQRKVIQNLTNQFRIKAKEAQEEFINSNSNQKYSVLLERLNNFEAGNLTNAEKVFIYQQKFAIYYEQKNLSAARDQLLNIIAFSPDLPISTEMETLKTLSQVYYLLDDNQQALTHLLSWAEYQNVIMPMQYVHFSKLYEHTGNFHRAAANFARALELKKSAITNDEYELLKSLYESSGNLIEAQKVDAIMEKSFMLTP